MRKVIFYTSIALVSFFSCRKPTEKLIPTVPLEPVLTFESLNKSNVKAFGDSLVFTVSYTDGDGDLGDFNSDSLSLYLMDTRSASLYERYHIAPSVPANVKVAIQGQLRIVLDHTILLNSASASETSVFKIKVKDRAGHWSNLVSSPTITIKP
ncbi:MAG: hypothetical protein RL138_402 [Bacteroidota bacterium]|jgi:hypothetical protein